MSPSVTQSRFHFYIYSTAYHFIVPLTEAGQFCLVRFVQAESHYLIKYLNQNKQLRLPIVYHSTYKLYVQVEYLFKQPNVFNWAIPNILSLTVSFSRQLIIAQCLWVVFEPGSSGVGSNCFANSATTNPTKWVFLPKYAQKLHQQVIGKISMFLKPNWSIKCGSVVVYL